MYKCIYWLSKVKQSYIHANMLHASYTDTVHRLLNAWNVLWVGTRIGDLHAKYIKSDSCMQMICTHWYIYRYM